MAVNKSRKQILNEVSDETLINIRQKFFEKYKASVDGGLYDPIDLERLNSGTDWVRAFYKHGILNEDRTLGIMNEALLWRKKFEANSLLTPGKLPFPEQIFNLGAMFYRNKDINGIPILNFIVKTHKKGNNTHEHICKLIAYFLEKNYKFNINNPIVLLFDMSDSGYSNTDMEMTRFLVNCLKTYYVGLIEYIVVYDMPTLFQAVWKIIKTLLPAEAVDLVKFTDKKSVKEFFTEDNLFVHMGGKVAYKYAYAPNIFEISADNEPQLA